MSPPLGSIPGFPSEVDVIMPSMFPLHLFFFFFLKVFIYLFGPLNLSCSTQDRSSLLWLAGSFSCCVRALRCGMWDLVPGL